MQDDSQTQRVEWRGLIVTIEANRVRGGWIWEYLCEGLFRHSSGGRFATAEAAFVDAERDLKELP